jgi:hypothetical protein
MIDRPKACLLATCGGLISFLPVLKVSVYVFDFAKDVALFMYFGLDRWGFIHFETIHGLIVYYGVSIFASSLAMTYIIQVTKDNGIININTIDNIYQRRFLRVVLFLLSPITPITIIVKSVWLSMKMTRMLAKGKKVEDSSPSNLWLEMEKMKEEKKKVSTSFSHLKMMEINLEAVVQLFVLITFYFVPRIVPKAHGLGSEFESNDQSWISWLLLIGSTSFTAFSVISSTLSATNLSKGGQLGIKAKLFLGISLTLQISSHMLKNVPIALASLGVAPTLSPIKAALLLALPTLVHWILLLVFMPLRLTEFQDRLTHMVSNMWMVHPARTIKNHKDQVHKSREQTLALTSVLINTTITSIIAAFLMEGDGKLTSLKLPASVEFLVVGGVPSILSHLLGCLFLALYYYCSHTWREMGKEREEGRCSFLSRAFNQQDPVIAENPSSEQVELQEALGNQLSCPNCQVVLQELKVHVDQQSPSQDKLDPEAGGKARERRR